MKKDLINYSDFQKLDIRVGQIKDAAPVEKSTKLLQLQVDFGEDYGVVEILSGIAQYYQPEDIIGKKYPFLANLEPKPMMGKISQGMIMAADRDGAPILSPLDDAIPVGSAVR